MRLTLANGRIANEIQRLEKCLHNGICSLIAGNPSATIKAQESLDTCGPVNVISNLSKATIDYPFQSNQQIPPVVRVTPRETSRRTTQLSLAQIADLQNLEQIKWWLF